ncbi:MAG TPA: hypothetical protein VL049_13860 [Candidatus Dormibacteraeota bacterium]|nr:hypothetical protein [Candidatus Dormibacteraeota bacterium]
MQKLRGAFAAGRGAGRIILDGGNGGIRIGPLNKGTGATLGSP